MPTISLTDQELQSLINVIANAPVPWVVSNPLLMRIGAQQRAPVGNGPVPEADPSEQRGTEQARV